MIRKEGNLPVNVAPLVPYSRKLNLKRKEGVYCVNQQNIMFVQITWISIVNILKMRSNVFCLKITDAKSVLQSWTMMGDCKNITRPFSLLEPNTS